LTAVPRRFCCKAWIRQFRARPWSWGSVSSARNVVAALGARAVSASRVEGPCPAPRFVKLDARIHGSLGEVLRSVRPTAIVDCAAFSSVSEAESHPDLARRMNVDVPRELGEWCRQHGAGSSTCRRTRSSGDRRTETDSARRIRRLGLRVRPLEGRR
jgi:hypothetical protein